MPEPRENWRAAASTTHVGKMSYRFWGLSHHWGCRRLEPARQQKARTWWVMTYLCSLGQSTVIECRGTCWFKLAPYIKTPVTIWFSPYDSRQCALGLLKLALEKAVEWDLPLRPLACTSTVVASCSGRSLVRRTLYLRKHRPIAHMTFPSHSRFAQSVCVPPPGAQEAHA